MASYLRNASGGHVLDGLASLYPNSFSFARLGKSPIADLYIPYALLWLTLALCLTKLFYNLYLHPLNKFPGPWSAACSRAYYSYYLKTGNLPFQIKKLHDYYGPCVRIAPNELSYTSPEAWQDIYNAKGPEFEKDMGFLMKPPNGVDSVMTASRYSHKRLRKVLASPLSDKALVSQEALISAQTSLLVNRLKALAHQDKSVNLLNWFNCTSFDVLGDLAFGEPFGCLSEGNLHSWAQLLHDTVGSMGDIQTFKRFFPGVFDALMFIAIKSGSKAVKRQMEQFDFCANKAKERMAKDTDRPDFMTYILRTNNDQAMSEEEIMSNAQVLITAGSETAASCLTSTMYYLRQNPPTYAKLTEELRSTFLQEDDITMHSTRNLPYLNAVINEVMRIQPPIPTSIPRIVPAGGRSIAGQVVPGGYSVGVNHWASYHSAENFVDPEVFVPERWLGGERYAEDKKTAFQPWSVGSRNCLGMNLAHAEIRLVLSRVLWNFDIDLLNPEEFADSRKVIVLIWDSKPLYAKLQDIRQ